MRLITRIAEPRDEPFIYSCWLNGAFYSQPNARKISDTDKRRFNHDLCIEIKRILKSGTIVVASPDDDDDLIIGYSVTDSHKLHWIYVKAGYRGQGIGHLLIKANPYKTIQRAHLTTAAWAILEKRPEYEGESNEGQ